MSQPTPPGPRLNLRGAVDLSSLTRRPAGPAAAAPTAQPSAGAGSPTGGAPAGGPAVGPSGPPPSGPAPVWVVDVTEATFPDVVQLSAQVPVVVDLRASWSEPSQQLSPLLERVVQDYGGRLLLAHVDVDTDQQIAAAFQVQSVPSVVAIVKGQPVPLFQGAHPEDQVRQVLDSLLVMAEQNGVTGRLPGPGGPDGADGGGEPAPPALPPLHQEAADAIDRGDVEAAAEAYRRALLENPADGAAKGGLAQVELLTRVRTADLQQARAAAAADPSDIDAAMLVADLDLAGGHVTDAFTRLIDLVRLSGGDDRDRLRQRLLDLFEVVGPEDPQVVLARRSLAAALF